MFLGKKHGLVFVEKVDTAAEELWWEHGDIGSAFR